MNGQHEKLNRPMSTLEQRLHTYEPLWDNWEISSQLFFGTNSSVFLMERNRREETLVSVLKVVELIPKEDQDLDRRLEQLMEEIHRMERLDDSPYIVSLKDDLILERPDGGYDVLMRMEYLDCLETMIREESLPWQSPSAKESGTTVVEEVIRMAEDLCRALGSIHGQGMLHRDIKPGNIYRERGGNRWKLGDFGASRTLAFGNDPSTITGTTAYMAPEIARGDYQALSFTDTKVGGFTSTWNGATVAVLHNTMDYPVTVDLSQVTDIPFTTLAAYVGLNACTLEGTVLTLGGQTSAVLR